ncbi:MAG: hypothetical protein IJW79_00890 [Clostridia bacterium]|nr:hypothetical protein [Clostridia bacterium]
MNQAFMCSLCHNGILGGVLWLDAHAVIYKTNKLTVDKKFRNLAIPLKEVKAITWKRVVFPVAKFQLQNGEEYKFIIFNKKRFNACYEKIKSKEVL